jgi:magnesium-transporting ATPase (P-type)
VISLAVWLIEGARGVPFEGIAIIAIVLLNAGLGHLQEEKAEAAVTALRRMTTTTVAVVRGGRTSGTSRWSCSESTYLPWVTSRRALGTCLGSSARS